MAAKIEEKPVKKASAKKTVKKTAEVPVNGNALKKAIAERETPKKKIYGYGEIWAMRWRVDEDTVCREFLSVPVETEEDIINYPDKIADLRKKVRNEISDRKEHWFFSDDKAIQELLKDLESDTDCVRHDLEYDSCGKDKLVDQINVFHQLLKVVNTLIITRRTLAEMVKRGELDKVPKVAPPSEDYRIDTRLKKFVRRLSITDIEKELGFKKVDIKDAPKSIQNLAKKLEGVGTVSVATVINTEK